MWLLDHNLPSKLQGVLTSYNITSATTYRCGWAALRNGDLVASAYKKGYRVILTRDILFGESAARALSVFPEMAVVLLKLPQAKAAFYIAAFKKNWEATPILPKPGKLVIWG